MPVTTCPHCAELLSDDGDDSDDMLHCASCLRPIDDPERRTEIIVRRCIIGAFVLAATATMDHLLLTWLHTHF